LDQNTSIQNLQKRLLCLKIWKPTESCMICFSGVCTVFLNALLKIELKRPKKLFQMFLSKSGKWEASSLKSVNLKEYLYIIARIFLLTILQKATRIKRFLLTEVDFEPVIQIKTPRRVINFCGYYKIKSGRQSGSLSPKCKIIFQLIKEMDYSIKKSLQFWIYLFLPYATSSAIFFAIKKISELLPQNLLLHEFLSRWDA